MILDKVGQQVLHRQSCSLDLLGNEARGGHTWGGIDLEEGWATIGFDDVVDTDDTAGIDVLIDFTSELLYQSCESGLMRAGGNLLDCAVVLGLEVKEAILGHDFCHRESRDGVTDTVASAGHLGARNEALEEDLIAFVKGEGNGLVQCLKALNLRGRYAGASSIRLRKKRKAEALDKLFSGGAEAIAQ